MGKEYKFYSGTSGLVLPVPNKAVYPPEFRDKPRLTYYASLFNSIEINSSFYKVPMAATVSKWVDLVPNDFRFTYKLWQGVTHEKGLIFDAKDVWRFMKVINEADDKKGCLLVQFPPGIRVDSIAQVERLLTRIRESDEKQDWKITVEFRHRSWYVDKTYHLLQKLNMSMVIHDLPPSASPMETLDMDYVYLRFHGPDGGYRGSYTDDFLQEYAGYINDWLEDGKTVYAYFNNTIGDAVKNLATLNNYVQTIL